MSDEAASDSDTTSDSSSGPIHPIVEGSSRQALIAGTFIFATAFSAAVAVGPVVNLSNLSPVLKNILVGASSATGALSQLPVAIAMDQGNEKRAILIVRAISLIGAIGLTVLSLLTDLREMDSADWRFFTTLFFTLLAGVSLGTFPLITNVLYWGSKNAGSRQAIYAGMGGLGLASALIGLQFSLEIIGIPTTFGLFSALLFLGGVVAAKYIKSPPYQQLLEAGCSPVLARQIAEQQYGQEKFPNPPVDGYFISALKLFKDLRVFSLVIAVLSSFGGFLAATVSMFLMLTDLYEMSPRDAVIITAVGSFWSTTIRMLVGKPVDSLDKTNGVYTFVASSSMVIIGSIILVSMHDNQNLALTLFAKYFMDAAYGIGSAATFRKIPDWSDPENTNFAIYNIGAASGDVSTWGAASGFLLPTGTALLLLAFGQEGYFVDFFLRGLMSLLALGLVVYSHYKVNHHAAVSSDDSSPSSPSSEGEEGSVLELSIGV